jgi:hypothetical protein
VVFRYRNNRCYYFIGIDKGKAVLLLVKDGISAYVPYEKTLATEDINIVQGNEIKLNISVAGSEIKASFLNGPSFTVTDTTFQQGKIGLLADAPTAFSSLEVTTDKISYQNFTALKTTKENQEASLQKANPKPVLWKKINTAGFGVGRNLRFGDLNGDSIPDVLIGQVVHHGPKDRNSELSCLTAMTFEGKILWQKGLPDPWKTDLTNDVAFQIHDIDNDGKNEVIYCMNQEIVIAEGATGKIIRKAPTPLVPEGGSQPNGYNRFERILGDCLYFCDLEGKGYACDIIIKDRYKYLWAMDSQLQILWQGACHTGHYPWALDINNDKKDELMMGYTLFASNGKPLWSLDKTLKDHADGVALVKFRDNLPLRLLCAASDEGMIFADLQGNILKHYFIGHVQNPAVANFRDDLPGLESVSVNFWGNQGIIHLYDAEGNIYHDFEPTHFGSMCLPINWTGKSEEFFVLNANVAYGGMYDGWGRKVVQFPDDGHPDMCYAVLDITGDCRDEIVVWDPNEIWVYTQDKNPLPGRLYHPKRNPLYNYSNYQVTVSVPGW